VKALTLLVVVVILRAYSANGYELGAPDEVPHCCDPVQKGFIQILAIHGSAKISNDTGRHWTEAKAGQRVHANYALWTARNSTLDLEFKNVGAVRLAPRTKVGVDRFVFVDEIQELQIDLHAGRIVVLSERLSPPSKFEIKTLAGVVRVREEPSEFDINSIGIVRCMLGSLIEVFVTGGILIPPIALGPDSKTVIPKFGDEPKAGPAKLEAQEKRELAAELESLRQSMLHPAAVLVEAEKGRGIRRTKGNPW
jgi:hypothetical protein